LTIVIPFIIATLGRIAIVPAAISLRFPVASIAESVSVSAKGGSAAGGFITVFGVVIVRVSRTVSPRVSKCSVRFVVAIPFAVSGAAITAKISLITVKDRPLSRGRAVSVVGGFIGILGASIETPPVPEFIVFPALLPVVITISKSICHIS